jgi:hypothetical protein
MNVNQRLQRHTVLVGDSRSNVIRVHLEEQLRHLLQRRRSPRVDARAKTGSPGEQQQVAVVRVVVRVLMRHENVAQARQRNAGKHELTRDAVTAIDDVRGVVDDDHLCRRRAQSTRPGPAPRA